MYRGRGNNTGGPIGLALAPANAVNMRPMPNHDTYAITKFDIGDAAWLSEASRS